MSAQPQTEVVPAKQQDLTAALLESVLIGGDLAKLSPADRIQYYRSVCQSVGLNPLTKPFEYISLNGRLTLYAKKDCTDQLRQRDGVSINIVAREILDDVFSVTARARTPAGREDEAIGAVAIGNLKGESKANALMKAETKAKRRVTLSICGLGMLDESEVYSVPDARQVTVDPNTGEIKAEEQRNTKEQQAELKERVGKEATAKIHEMQTAPPQVQPGSPDDQMLKIWDRMKTKKGCIEELTALKKEMMELVGTAGESDYYRVLEKHGVKHANEFANGELARACAKDVFVVLHGYRKMKEWGQSETDFDRHMEESQ